MKTITILALDNVLASSVMGTMDILCQAGLTYNHIAGKDRISYFNVQVATEDGKPVKGFNNILITPHCSAKDIDHTDVIIISSFMDFETLESNKNLLEWIIDFHNKGAIVASVCVGSFFLAQTGLLNGKTATTHWGFAKDFYNLFPKVILRPDQLITDEGSLICSGACNSYIDLSVHLIERFCGKTTAVESSKAMVHDFGRNTQAPYCMLKNKKSHKDKEIRQIQELIEKDPAQSFVPESAAKNFGMSRRTFERRFKLCTGDTPISYLQQIRVETAKHNLETTHMTFDEISYKSGYEDASFFRKIFKKHTGLLPGDYRMKFQR
ncbi:MAG: helix-turn-helix domain-containing protein [Desulfobacteraceae bacterium]|nr:helix-turn-helix domain-containing protein [Desulfobacteraceae bacterium]